MPIPNPRSKQRLYRGRALVRASASDPVTARAPVELPGALGLAGHQPESRLFAQRVQRGERRVQCNGLRVNRFEHVHLPVQKFWAGLSFEPARDQSLGQIVDDS